MDILIPDGGAKGNGGEKVSGFVLLQVEIIDEGQKDSESGGARAHFLPISGGSSKTNLSVTGAEKKPAKVKKPNLNIS